MARFILYGEAMRVERAERSRMRLRLREAFLEKPLPDAEFVRSYRLSPTLFEALCEDIIPLLPPKKNTRGIEPITKIFTALSFYGRGSYQGAVGLNLDGPMAQQTVSKCLQEVTEALNEPIIVRKYIKFPQNQLERNILKEKFYEKFGIPGIIGCIDCSHIAIVRPHENEERFFNRKHFHSINCQVICDTNNKVLNIDASYGGATHDSFIWQNGEIREHLESISTNTDETAQLLGDSGYPLRRYMMTPVDGALENSPEGRYNAIQKRARSTIERTFGILKGRWRCLLAARQLHYSPQVACKIAIACCVLHNMCIDANIDPIDLTQDEALIEGQIQVGPAIIHIQAGALEEGRRARNNLIQLLNRNE